AMNATGFQALVESDRGTFEVQTAAAGPAGRLPLTAEMLLERPSGDVFGLTQNAGMGWDPRELGRPQFLMLGTNGGLRAADGLPAMTLTLAAMRALPVVLVPGGVTLPPTNGEDAGKVQSIGARFAHGELTLEQAQDLGCRACGSPGGGCQFLGTAATSQVVGE